MALINPPTMHMHVGRPFTPPASYHWVNHPCDCGCPECTRWTIFLTTLTLIPSDQNECYTGNSPVNMPLSGSVTVPWCVSLKGNTGTLTVYPAERMFEGDIPTFVIDGREWDYFTLGAGEEACVCIGDDGNWHVTGDAHGAMEGPN